MYRVLSGIFCCCALLHLPPSCLPQVRPADCLQWVPTSDSQEAGLAAARRTKERTSSVLVASAEPYGEARAQLLTLLQ
jgi:hypothetical protein